jgi:hypothetical protein
MRILFIASIVALVIAIGLAFWFSRNHNGNHND